MVRYLAAGLCRLLRHVPPDPGEVPGHFGAVLSEQWLGKYRVRCGQRTLQKYFRGRG
jgi:hypothetical protein